MLFFIPVFGEVPNYSEPYSPIFTDKNVYSWTDKVKIMVVAPSWNAERNGIDTIGSDPEHSISISSREHELENYKLTETDLNSGIFVGEVILTGFEHDADGDGDIDTNPKTFGRGPTNGFLQTDRDSAITISFEFADGVVLTHSALINWNVGDVRFFESQYTENQSPVIRVTDFDMNLNPEGIDQIPVKISSDSDTAGITIDAIEINENSGIFEATISISQDSASSGNRLYALPGDSLLAKYDDNTLPTPYSKDDELEINAKAGLGSSIPNLERLSIEDIFIADRKGEQMSSLHADDQIQIVGKVRNQQIFNQNFVLLFQITNEKGTVMSLSWIQGNLEKFQELNLSQSWNPLVPGTYTMETFVWDSLQSPLPLTTPVSRTYTVE